MTKKTKDTEAVKVVTKSDNPKLDVANCDLEQIRIEPLIHLIRGQQVILDRDLALLYGVETRRLNEQVRRNIERFPEDFMFQLTHEEFENWKSQFATSNSIIMGARKRPYAFTESGIAMLSSVLRSPTAIEVNVRIMRTFVAMRHFLASNTQVFQRLSNIEYHQIETDKRIDEVFKRLDANTQPQQGIFYDGQVFDAYQFVSDLVRKANTLSLKCKTSIKRTTDSSSLMMKCTISEPPSRTWARNGSLSLSCAT